MTSHFPKIFHNCHLRFLSCRGEPCPQVKLISHTPLPPREHTAALLPSSLLPEHWNAIRCPHSALCSLCTLPFTFGWALPLPGYLISSLPQCSQLFHHDPPPHDTCSVSLNLMFYFVLILLGLRFCIRIYSQHIGQPFSRHYAEGWGQNPD